MGYHPKLTVDIVIDVPYNGRPTITEKYALIEPKEYIETTTLRNKEFETVTPVEIKS
jgi:hypothetical protein